MGKYCIFYQGNDVKTTDIWMPSSISGLTSITFNTELTHFGSEAPIEEINGCPIPNID